MTIRTRNRLYFGLLIASSLCCIGYVLLLVVSAARGIITGPLRAERMTTFMASPYSFAASMAAIFVFTLYVPAVTAAIYRGFEKTQSQEIIYFTGILLGCMLESVRLGGPLLSLWQTPSAPLAAISRIVIAGRTLTYLSILSATLFYGVEFRQSVEQNCIICLLVAALAGMCIPLSTMFTTSTFIARPGNPGLFFMLRFGLATVAILTMLVQAFKNNNAEQKYNIAGCAALLCGYAFLCSADNYVHLALGALLLPGGTVVYLKSLHTLYLWR